MKAFCAVLFSMMAFSAYLGAQSPKPPSDGSAPGTRYEETGTRKDQQPAARNDQSGTRKDQQPAAQKNQQPAARKDQSGTRKDQQPAARNDQSGTRKDQQPAARNDQSGTRKDQQPAARNDQPGARKDQQPAARKEEPGARKDEPGARKDQPAARKEEPKRHEDPKAKVPVGKPEIPRALGSTTPRGWYDDWNRACSEARRTNRPILVLFTGSDWCHWCKVLHEEVLDSSEFRRFAEDNLILVYMDSPSGVELPSRLERTRKQLARILGAGSGVPCTVILSPRGDHWGEISGYDPNYLGMVRGILERQGY